MWGLEAEVGAQATKSGPMLPAPKTCNLLIKTLTCLYCKLFALFSDFQDLGARG